ncbi:hypothetical protein Tco_0491120 [Tanacetum coccineum]
MIKVLVTIKILVITNLHIIHRVSHNNLIVVKSVEVPIIALIVKLGTILHHSTAPVTPPPLAYTPTPPVLATIEPLDTFLMGDEVISTIPAREINEFMKSSVNDLVPIPKESEGTSNREHLDTLSTGDREIDFNPIRDIEELECLLADDPVPVPRVFDKPLEIPSSESKVKCKYVTRNTGKGRKNEENMDSYESLRRNLMDALRRNLFKARHVTQQDYGVTKLKVYVVTSLLWKAKTSKSALRHHGFVGYPFDYHVTLGFGSIMGGLDLVNPVIRLPLEHGISRVLGKDDYSNPRVGTNPVTASIT